MRVNGQRHSVEARRGGPGWLVSFDGRPLAADLTRIGERWSLLIAPPDGGRGRLAPPDGGPCDPGPARSYDLTIEARGRSERIVHVGGQAIRVSLTGGRPGAGRRDGPAAAAAGPARVESPMAGRIVRVLVRAGETVAAGQGLVVVEAMKMETELRAPRGGTVTDVRVGDGASIDAGTVVVVIE